MQQADAVGFEAHYKLHKKIVALLFILRKRVFVVVAAKSDARL